MYRDTRTGREGRGDGSESRREEGRGEGQGEDWRGEVGEVERILQAGIFQVDAMSS